MKQAAFAAMTWFNGPPCMPGNTARSSACACSSRQRTNPERGPASVLCVVDVTKSQCSTGFGWSPAATSANLHGGADPRRLADVPHELLDAVAVVLDGSELPGTPSTVVDLTGPEPCVLREGAVPAAEALARLRE